MATDFNYNNKTIAASGPFKPTGKDMPVDARTRVESYADIASIPNPHIGLKITVKADETNNNEMTDYIVKSLKANSMGNANSLIDEVVRYVDYLGVSGGGSGEGLTSTQRQQLQTAYEHSQSTHVTSDDLLNIDAVSLNGKKISGPMTKVEYDAIPEKDSNTIYLVDDDSAVEGIPNYSITEANKILAVNNEGTALAWVDAPSGSVSQEDINTAVNNYLTEHPVSSGATAEQAAQIQVAYEHSQSPHVNSNDIPTKISQLENDSKFVTQTQLDNVVISAGGFTVKNLSTSEISEILSAISVVIPVESITASTNYLSINVGETRQITYNILPANATDKTVVYSSSDNSKLTVDQEGNIEAIEPGDFMITLTCSNGISTDCQVVVSEVSETVDVTGISLNKSSLSMHTGDSVSLIASITPTTATNKSVVWESNEPTIASVANGRVTALADGEAIITCRSVSNPDITTTCTVSVTTLETLTSITDGLVHSYNLAGLSGDSTTVDDLTGTVPLTLDGFEDVVSSKTANGILVDSTKCLLKQGSVSPTTTNKYSIAFTVIGPIAASQGLLSCNTHGNTKGFAISTSNTNPRVMVVTDVGFLLDDIFTIRDEYTYETIVVTIDYDVHEFKIYSHGELINTVDISSKSYEWSNIAWFNKGYWGGASGITYRNILMYNKVLSEEEVSTITSEICPKNYLTTNSPIISNNSNIMTHISCKSNVNDGKLVNLVNENYGLNVLSSGENGFLVSEAQNYSQIMNNKASYIIKTGPIVKNSNQNRFISALVLKNDFESVGSIYSYIQDSKITVRSTSVYLLENSELSETADNIIAIIVDMDSKNIKFYINNQLKNTVTPTTKMQFRSFENTIIPMKEYIVYNKLLDETELTNIYNELIGGN